MSITVKLIDSIQTIENNINIAIANKLNAALVSNTSNIISKIKLYIPIWIKNQPEVISLSDNTVGSLRGAFGIQQNGNSIAESISNAIVDSITFSFQKFDTKLNGGLTINIQPDSFQNLLLLSDGHTLYENGDLHWLDWLLTKGDEIIVANYFYNPSTGIGRSGLGNMQQGGAFRVPPQYSGNSNDNFVTRALNGTEQIQKIIDIISLYLT